jgi:diadenosine tetraphosphate (Ap4A) HIT family hydrolase
MNDSPEPECPFCEIPANRVLAANDHAIAVLDAYPVSPGHSLVVARRHVVGFFDLDVSEAAGMLELLRHVRSHLEETHAPQGYNVGINVGVVAGQTIPHVHIHLIPRYSRDVVDPTGGVRNIIPGHGRYCQGP